jgi:hypothetical protein
MEKEHSYALVDEKAEHLKQIARPTTELCTEHDFSLFKSFQLPVIKRIRGRQGDVMKLLILTAEALRTTKTLRYISHQIILRRLLWKK